ncbi:unnamed protein product [Coccothraustes coccothraustes]
MSQGRSRSSQELDQFQSPTEAEPAAAAPAGAAEEEEPLEPLAPEAEEAAWPPAPREELPSAGAQSPVPGPVSPPGCSQAVLDLAWLISCVTVRQVLLETQGCGQQPQEQRQQEGREDAAVAGTGRAEREESPVPAPHSPPGTSQAVLDLAWLISCVTVRQVLLETQGCGQQPQEQRQQEGREDAAVAGTGRAEREESPVPAPHSPPGTSQDVLDLAWLISCVTVRQVLLETQGCGQQPQEQRQQEGREDAAVAGTGRAEREESPVPAPHSPPGTSQAVLDLAWLISCVTVRQVLLETQGCGQQPQEQRQQEGREDAAVAGTGRAEREESPVPAPHSPPGTSQAVLDLAWLISCVTVRQVLLETQGCGQQPQEQRQQEGREDAAVAGTGRAEREESPVPAPHSPPGTRCAQLGFPAPREQPEWAVAEVSQEGSQESSASESDWDASSEEEGEETEAELSEWTDSSLEEVSQDDNLSSGTWDFLRAAVGQVKEEERQPSLPPEGPSTASPVGTEVAAEAGPALTSASPSLQSPTEAEPAAAAPAGAAEEGELPELLRSQGEDLGDQELLPGEDDGSNEETKFWQFLDDLEPFLVGDPELSQQVSDCGCCIAEDLPHREVTSYHQLSGWEEYLDQELSQGEASNSQDASVWEDYIEQVLPGGDVIRRAELSNGEDYVGQDLSQGEVDIGQDVSRGNGSRPSGHSSWENESDMGLTQETCEDETEHGIGTKPLAPEDDEWDKVSILELLPEEDKDRAWKGFGAAGLPVPFPREAWAECPAQKPRSRGPGPAPHSPPSPWPELAAQALRGQPAAPRKRPSRFRRALRALRGLFRCPCLSPRPEE